MPHRRPPHLAPDLYVGPQRLFLTMCTLNRMQYFRTAAFVDPMREQLLRTARDYRVDVPAYVFMPDHFHALLEGMATDSHVLKCAVMFRQRSGYHFRQQQRRKVWQEGFFDRFLRDEDSTLDVARYIVANPMRAGLCSDVREYPFIGSTRYSIDELVGSVTWQP